MTLRFTSQRGSLGRIASKLNHCVHIEALINSGDRIRTAFGYVPNTRPGPPSLLRQLAYQQGCPLPNPLTDPEGWKILRPVSCRGTMMFGRVDARCTVRTLLLLEREYQY